MLLNDATNDELIKQKSNSIKNKIGINNQRLDQAKDFLIRLRQDADVKIISAIRTGAVFMKNKQRSK